jgi:hypothetical protein
MNPAAIVKGIILKMNSSSPRSSVHLSIPPDLSEFHWDDGHFKDLIEKFVNHVLEISHPDCPVRVAVHEMKRKKDLEEFFSIHPEYWLHLSVESQAETGFESGAKRILEGLGYECSEWIGVEDTESQLGAYHFGTEDKPALIIFVQNHGARRNCDFLIPVVNAALFGYQPGYSCS